MSVNYEAELFKTYELNILKSFDRLTLIKRFKSHWLHGWCKIKTSNGLMDFFKLNYQIPLRDIITHDFYLNLKSPHGCEMHVLNIICFFAFLSCRINLCRVSVERKIKLMKNNTQPKEKKNKYKQNQVMKRSSLIVVFLPLRT